MHSSVASQRPVRCHWSSGEHTETQSLDPGHVSQREGHAEGPQGEREAEGTHDQESKAKSSTTQEKACRGSIWILFEEQAEGDAQGWNTLPGLGKASKALFPSPPNPAKHQHQSISRSWTLDVWDDE